MKAPYCVSAGLGGGRRIPLQAKQIVSRRCRGTVHLSIGTDDWGVHFISYGNRDEMTELVNIILEWKYKAEQFDKLPVKLVESPELVIRILMEKKNELLNKFNW